MPGLLSNTSPDLLKPQSPAQMGSHLEAYEKDNFVQDNSASPEINKSEAPTDEHQQQKVERVSPLLDAMLSAAETDRIEGERNTVERTSQGLSISGSESMQAQYDPKTESWQDRGSQLSAEYVEQIEQNLPSALEQHSEQHTQEDEELEP